MLPSFVRPAALLLVTAAAARAQQPVAMPSLADTTRPPVQVMILGVFHFHNPNADFAKFEGIDVLTPTRQGEIEDVVTRLARFAPTKIAVEAPPSASDSLDASYARYRAGAFGLSRNEIHQLGFRLAARLGLGRVHPVDFQMGMRIDSVIEYARANDPSVATGLQEYIGRVVATMDRMQRDESIRANLLFMNEPANVWRAHEPYAVMATLGAGDGFIGARVAAGWYERNLRIFANVARVSDPEDRILLIIGAGHAPILRHLVETHPGMRIVEAAEYLGR